MQVLRELTELARTGGLKLAGEDDHLGYSKPRDRDSSFAAIVAKRQRRLTGWMTWSFTPSAKELTHGEIAAHPAEV